MAQLSVGSYLMSYIRFDPSSKFDKPIEMEKVVDFKVDPPLDKESDACLAQMMTDEQVKLNRVPNVQFVLVVLSSAGLVFDKGALSQKIMASYPNGAVFFQNTDGNAIGPECPPHVDLLIDFTGPGQRQSLFFSKKLRKMARIAVGRNAGLFRKRIYDRIFDEKAQNSKVPKEILQRERFVQRKVLNLAGVAFLQAGETPIDQSKTIALELPPMHRL